MKHFFTHLALLCLFGTAFAQQDPQFSQYMHNKLFMNPAYAGMKEALCFSGIARQQWAGFDGSPRSGVLSADMYVDKLSGGVGINLMYDQLGFEKNMAYRIAYSFHRENVLGGRLGIGIEVGAATKILGPTGGQSWISTTNWQTDPTVPPRISDTNFDCGLGLWYQSEKIWFGISSTHVTGGKFNDGNTVINGPPLTTHTLLYKITRHYWVTGGYNWSLQNWTIKPSFLVKSDATVTSVDLNCIASFNNGFWIGTSWRIKDAVCPMIGFEWLQESALHKREKDKDKTYKQELDPEFNDKLRPAHNKYSICKIGFAYDYTTSKLTSYNTGGFEIFISYCIPYVPRTARHGDVRIFDKP